MFNILNNNAAVSQSQAVSTTISPFLPQSAGGSDAVVPTCGVGGPVTTITNPSILKLALMFRF
jgi:hypothetical protein